MKLWQRIASRQWTVRGRILATLVLLTAAILLAVAVAFHLSVRGYVYSRVSEQMDSLVKGIVSDRRGGGNGRGGAHSIAPKSAFG